MKFKVTVVVDNCVPINCGLPFLGEHGLSMLLETSGKRLLLDGQSAAVIQNLSLLGVAPGSLDMLAISHGHYDHTGGLYPLLSHAQKTLPVYIHEEAFATLFARPRATPLCRHPVFERTAELPGRRLAEASVRRLKSCPASG